MPRVKGGPRTRRRHNDILKATKGQWGSKHRLHRRAQEALLKSLTYAYRHRRERKGDMRRLWIQRINAAARLQNTTYSQFMHGLHQAGVEVDRKMLADLAVRDPSALARLVQVAQAAAAREGAASSS